MWIEKNRFRSVSFPVAFLILYCGAVIAVTAPLVDWRTSMHFDSAVRVWILQQPWDSLFHNVIHIELSPPLWHLTAKVLVELSPLSPVLTIRGANYVLFLALIPAGYVLGSLLGGRRTAVISALLLPWNQFVFDYVTRIDHYLLFAFFTVVYSILLVRALRDPRFGRLFALGIWTTAYGLIHYFAATYVFTTAITTLAVYTYRKWVCGEKSGFDPQTNLVALRKHRFRARFPAVFLPLTGLYLLWIPSFLTQYSAYTAAFGAGQSVELLRAAKSFVGLLRSYIPTPPFFEGILAITIFVVLVFALRAATRDVSIQIVLCSTGLTYAIVVVSGLFYDPRHVFFLAGLIPIFVAIGINEALQEASDSRYSLRIGVAILVIVVATTYGASAATLQSPERETDLRGVSMFVDDHVNNETVVLVANAWGELILDVYNMVQTQPVYGIPVDALGDPPNTRVRPIHDELNQPYDPESHPAHWRRLCQVTKHTQKVVVVDARGTGYVLNDAFEADIRRLGFRAVDTIRSEANGATVYKRNSTRHHSQCTMESENAVLTPS